MKIDKIVILFIILFTIALVANIAFAKAVLSSDLPWWIKYFFIFK